jgi:integrase
MPRPRKLQPDYCNHKPSGRAFVRVGGRQVWLGRHGTQESKDRYLAAVAEWVAKGRPAADTETRTPKPARPGQAADAAGSAGPTVTVVIEPYWSFAQGYYRKHGRPTDEVGCVKVVLRLLRKMYGDLPVADFDSLKMLAFQQAMIDQGWARKTINDHMGRLKRALKWLASRKFVPATVYHESLTISGLEAGRSGARETEPKRPVPLEHVEAVMPWLSRQVRAMMRLQLLCGARPGELVLMRKADIDMSGKVWVYRPREHKTEHHDHDRQVFIGPEGQAVLAPFLMRPDDAPLFSPAESERERREARHAARRTPAGHGNAPGTNKSRRPKRPPADAYTVDSYRRAIARACDRANEWERGGKVVANDATLIGHWHPHRLRHNAATSIRQRYGAEAAKLAIGVKNMDVAELYAERDLKVVERIMGEVG